MTNRPDGASESSRPQPPRPLKLGGAALGTLAFGTQAFAQTPKPGGSFVSAQTTEATGLDPQLVPALSRSRRSPLMYSQLVRFDADMNVSPSWPSRGRSVPTGSRGRSSSGRA